MIGNDIVDLALAKKESNWKRSGFLSKIFTDKERDLINNTINPEFMVWNLWSRKEAVYKIINRETGIRAFIPLQLECVYENASSGLVIYNGISYYTMTTIKKDFLHTIAVSKFELFNKIKILDPETHLLKNNGVPFVLDQESKQELIVSKSHHGRFTILLTTS